MRWKCFLIVQNEQEIMEKYDLDQNGKIDQDELEGLLLWAKKNKTFGSCRQDDGGSAKNWGNVSEIGMIRQENGVPTKDAFWIMPVKREAYEQVDSVIFNFQFAKPDFLCWII